MGHSFSRSIFCVDYESGMVCLSHKLNFAGLKVIFSAILLKLHLKLTYRRVTTLVNLELLPPCISGKSPNTPNLCSNLCLSLYE